MSITIKMAAGDMVLLPQGQFQEIEGLEKSTQDLGEGLLNNYDPHDPPWYVTGSELYQIDRDTVSYNLAGIPALIQEMVSDAVYRLMEVQQEDPYVDDDELIVDMRSNNVWPASSTGMSWAFYVACITDSDQLVDYGFTTDLSQQFPAELEAVGLSALGLGVSI
jgi:hypothetical protein